VDVAQCAHYAVGPLRVGHLQLIGARQSEVLFHIVKTDVMLPWPSERLPCMKYTRNPAPAPITLQDTIHRTLIDPTGSPSRSRKAIQMGGYMAASFAWPQRDHQVARVFHDRSPLGAHWSASITLNSYVSVFPSGRFTSSAPLSSSDGR